MEPKELGETLKLIFEESGMTTYGEWAIDAGVSYPALERVLNGYCLPSIKMLEKIVAPLDREHVPENLAYIILASHPGTIQYEKVRGLWKHTDK